MGNAISFEEYLATYGKLTYSNVGISMLPLLRQGRDLFIIEPGTGERYKKGEVVLYRRPPDQYVLHRIIEVRPSDYVILGDNCIAKEYGIRDSDILGRMTGYVRGGKEHQVSEAGFRLYTFFWVHFADLRIFLKKIEMKLRRGGRRMLRSR